MLSNFPQISKYLYTSIDKCMFIFHVISLADSIFNTRNRNLKILDRNFTLNSRILNSFSSNDNHGENSNRDTPTNKLYHINESNF